MKQANEPYLRANVQWLGASLFAEFEADLLKMRTREGMATARGFGLL